MAKGHRRKERPLCDPGESKAFHKYWRRINPSATKTIDRTPS
jgi:hypothetical protein